MSRHAEAARTARAEAMIRDLEAIRGEAAWIIDHIADLDVIAHSKRHQEQETVVTGHSKATTSPDLSELWIPRLRNNLLATERLLRRHRLEITAARVGVERTLADLSKDRNGMFAGADSSLMGTELEPGELERLRKAKSRRDRNQGDYRYGEWEATPDVQPNQTYRG